MTGCVVSEKSLRICIDKAMEKGMGNTQRIHTEAEKKEPHGGQNLKIFTCCITGACTPPGCICGITCCCRTTDC